MNKLNKFLIVATASIIGLSSCTKYSDQLPTIAGIAVSNPTFSTLKGAAIQGGVAVTLSNKNPNDAGGNFTVFAPTNDAFARLGLTDAGTLGVLQNSFLTNTLLYHVSNGNLPGSSITNGGSSASALTIPRKFIFRGTDKYINGSKILATDVMASNGTVHVIDKVLLGTGVNIVASAQLLSNAQVFKSPELTFLVEAVVYSGLAPTLSDPANNFTIYAPTDAAFKAAGFATPASIRTLTQAQVQSILLNHAVGTGRFTSELNSTTATTAGGGTLTFGPFTNGVYTIKSNGITTPANMVIPDILCSNGVVHLIDKILLP
ncbi:MAG: fasciclin domain-containing protein [Sediminibacterium sp.]|nr:fasciclin domain-containing protein [Sediminibacterium sp.]MBX9779113.1 fasciclin domain-containing protein [Chitinophagaceae bacterium]